MADDEQVQILVNGDALHGDDTNEKHEMESITDDHISPGKEGIEPDTGMTNGGYDGENEEDEETHLVDNDTTDDETISQDNTSTVDVMVQVHGNSVADEEVATSVAATERIDLDAATEYENNGNTIKNYEDDGEGEKELETPEYTPPGSPEAETNHNKYTTIDINLSGAEDDKIRFIQHEGEDEATTRAESRSKFTRKTDWKCVCLSLLCFFVLLLAAAFAFFVAMFVTGGLDRVFGEEEAPLVSQPPQLPQGQTIGAPPIDKITTLVQMKLSRMWDVVLDAPSSPERQELDRLFINSMERTFRWSASITKLVYEKSIIEEFRPNTGSEPGIYVRFMCEFYDVPNSVLPAPDDPSPTPSTDDLYQIAEMYMSNVVQGTLAAAIDNGFLENIGALQGTIEIRQTDVTRG